MKRSILVFLFIAAIAVASADAYWQAQQAERVRDQRDPVCGLMVEKSPELTAAHKNQVYYFCSREDARKFRDDPEKYTAKR